MRQQKFEAALEAIIALVKTHPAKVRHLVQAAHDTDDGEEAAVLAATAGRVGVATLREIKEIAEEALRRD